MYIRKLAVRTAYKFGNHLVKKKVKKCHLKFDKPIFYCPALLEYQIFDLTALIEMLYSDYGLKSYRLNIAKKNLIKLSRFLFRRRSVLGFLTYCELDDGLPF